MKMRLAAYAGGDGVTATRRCGCGERRYPAAERQVGSDRNHSVQQGYGSRRRAAILRCDSHRECNHLLKHRRVYIRDYARRGVRLACLQRERVRARVRVRVSDGGSQIVAASHARCARECRRILRLLRNARRERTGECPSEWRRSTVFTERVGVAEAHSSSGESQGGDVWSTVGVVYVNLKLQSRRSRLALFAVQIQREAIRTCAERVCVPRKGELVPISGKRARSASANHLWDSVYQYVRITLCR